MNPLVADTIARMPISPLEYIWFDLTRGTELRETYSEWIEKHKNYPITDTVETLPMPYEKIGIIVPLDLTNITKNHFNDIVPYPITVDRAGNKLSLKTYYRGFQEYVNEIVMEGVIEEDKFEVSISQEYQKKFANVPGFFDRKNYSDIVKIFWARFAILIYGIPNSGSVMTGYKPINIVGNEQRRKKGKKQLFKWTTVELKTVKKEPAAPLGGTHASPMPHERRGHQRRYKSGKVVYIKPMLINKHKISTDGFIHHDYKVSA